MKDTDHYKQIIAELSQTRRLLLETYNTCVDELGHELALKRAIRLIPDIDPYPELVSVYSAEYGNRLLAGLLDEIDFFTYALNHLTIKSWQDDQRNMWTVKKTYTYA